MIIHIANDLALGERRRVVDARNVSGRMPAHFRPNLRRIGFAKRAGPEYIHAVTEAASNLSTPY